MITKIFILIYLITIPVFSADYEIVDRVDSIQVESSSFAAEHHKTEIRILTPAGKAYREMVGVNGYIQIKNITGFVRHPNGQTEPVRPDSVVEMPISQSADMFTDFKAIVIVPPPLKVGSVFTVQYDRNVTSLLYLDPWVYASSTPIRKASGSITFPSYIPVKYNGMDASVKMQVSENAGKKTISFETSEQPEIVVLGKPDQYGSMIRKITFVPEECMIEKWKLSTRSWQEIADWFSELSKFAYTEDPGMNAVVSDVLSRYRDPEEIASALYQYIQNHYVYTAIEIGIGGYKPHFSGQTFRKKYGDCKDLTILYLTLLKKAGIEGYPALVDTRSSRFFYKDFPNPSQFNHCIAFLPKIRNGTWVDSTVKNFKLGEVPAVIQGKYALVTGGVRSFLQIPEDYLNSNMLRFSVRGAVSDGQIPFQGKVETTGQASIYVDTMRNALMKNSVQFFVYSTLIEQGLPIRGLSATYENQRSMNLEFSVPLQNLAPYKVFLLNPLNYPPLENLALEPKPNEYFSLGVPLRLAVSAEVELAGMKMVGDSYKKEKKGQYVTYAFELREENGKIHYSADGYFSNGFLDQREMLQYQQELKEFAGLIQRTTAVRN